MMSHKIGFIGVSIVGILGSSSVIAEGTGIMEMQQTIEVLRRELYSKQQADERQITEFENRIKLLEKSKLPVFQLADKHAHGNEEEKEQGQINMALSGMMAMGGSTADDATLLNLQKGSHDPNRNGFTVQLLGLAFTGSLTPYLDARASIVSRIDPEGESRIELEEAYVFTRDLDNNLQIKAGQYFTEVGYLNAVHAHDWDFADKPVILSRFFGGDSLRNAGARLAWNAQTSWVTNLLVGIQHPKGETAVSFLSKPGEEIGGHILIDREVADAGDMLYSVKWARDWEMSHGISIKSSVSALWGPNASGMETRTAIYGFDVSVYWPAGKGLSSASVVSWNTEILHRRYEAGDPTDPTHETLRDWGMYTQLLWRFSPRWCTGLRLEYATGNNDNATDPLRDDRKRTSINLTWSQWKNMALRFQYNHDRAEHLIDHTANTFWLQLSYKLGGDDKHEH